jgi:hypothetical protein
MHNKQKQQQYLAIGNTKYNIMVTGKYKIPSFVGPNPTNLVVGIVARKIKRMSFQCAHR